MLGILRVIVLTMIPGLSALAPALGDIPLEIVSERPIVVNVGVDIDFSDKGDFKSARNILMDVDRLSLLDSKNAGVLESEPLIAPIPFSALGLKWTNLSDDEHPEISVRYSADGIEWSSWAAVVMVGFWYDPVTSGQGFVLHPINDEQMVVSFYGYRDNSERLWLIGLHDGQVAMGEPVLLDMTFASGGNFGDFDKEDITRTTWGTLTIEFDDCNNATATLDGIDGKQTLNMVKLAGLQGSGQDCH